MKLFLAIAVLAFAAPAEAANNAVNDACKRLCAQDSDCVRKCVGQAELFELRDDFINAVAAFTPKIDDRMRALRSGANLEILDICSKTGWSLDNKMICLRSYPTPEVIRNCKRLSPLQEEQVHCVRLGKSEAEVDSCVQLVPGGGHRLACLERNVTFKEIKSCSGAGGDTLEKMQCLERAEIARTDKLRHEQLDARVRRERSRAPASVDE